MALQVYIEDVVHSDEEDDADELDGVNGLEAVLHPEGAHKERPCDHVTADTEPLVYVVEFVVAIRCPGLLLRRDARVDHDAEGQEKRVLREQQDNEDAIDVAMGELVNQQVEDAHRLENEQALDLAPLPVKELVVVADANDHINCHHGGLDANPSLLESVAEGFVEGFVVERLLRDVVRVSF